MANPVSPATGQQYPPDSRDANHCQESLPSPTFSVRESAWVAVAGFFMLLSLAFALEISRRFLAGTLDVIAFLGALITLALTSTPLHKMGQDVAGELLSVRRPATVPYKRAQLVAVAAFFVAILLGAFLWLGMPNLALTYNDLGVAELNQRNLAAAKAYFERAMSLDANHAVPYKNLADTYLEIGQPEQAVAWYLKGIERDANFAGSYQGLSVVHNRTGQTQAAIAAALGGLYVLEQNYKSAPYSNQDKLIKSELLANLGRAYVVAGQPVLAQGLLEEAVALRSDAKIPDEGTATSYYWLARLYDQQGHYDIAYEQYNEALRFLNASERWNPDNIQWREIAKMRIAELGSMGKP